MAEKIERIHASSPDKGYRRIRDELERYHGMDVNDKRVLRLCRKLNIKSTIKYANNGCTRQSANPQYIAKNILNREFIAGTPNKKWLTDVTEFHYYAGIEKHKISMSAILDLYDRRIVSYVIRDHNNNALVFDTFDAALEASPNAHLIFHSDRGFQYTNRVFRAKLEATGMTQSMSKVAKCIDNGPMEGLWGIIKREWYYGKRFTSREAIVEMIENYIEYYNKQRLQRNLGVFAPIEKNTNYIYKQHKNCQWNSPLAKKLNILSIVYLTGNGSSMPGSNIVNSHKSVIADSVPYFLMGRISVIS
nr:IS3 family transposase [Clostridium sp. chh4-2]